MSPRGKTSLKQSIAHFYGLHQNLGKSYTYHHFKECGMSKRTIYRLLEAFDQNGEVKRRPGSGRRHSLSTEDQDELVNLTNDRSGVSQRKLAHKFKVSQKTICNTLKQHGVLYRKRIRAPKSTPAQEKRQRERLNRLAKGDFKPSDPREIVIDDESYFSLTGSGYPGNSGFYSKNPKEAPSKVRLLEESKFPARVLVWCAISLRGISDLYICKDKETVNGQVYREKCLPLLLKFIDENYTSREQVIFWPDLATAHYAEETQDFLMEHDVWFLQKEDNPPNAPQIRPIEKFWAILKRKVYENNWEADNKGQLVERIKEVAANLDITLFQNLMGALKTKVRHAADRGLDKMI